MMLKVVLRIKQLNTILVKISSTLTKYNKMILYIDWSVIIINGYNLYYQVLTGYFSSLSAFIYNILSRI